MDEFSILIVGALAKAIGLNFDVLGNVLIDEAIKFALALE